jgi:hypothetical protein
VFSTATSSKKWFHHTKKSDIKRIFEKSPCELEAIKPHLEGLLIFLVSPCNNNNNNNTNGAPKPFSRF